MFFGPGPGLLKFFGPGTDRVRVYPTGSSEDAGEDMFDTHI